MNFLKLDKMHDVLNHLKKKKKLLFYLVFFFLNKWINFLVQKLSPDIAIIIHALVLINLINLSKHAKQHFAHLKMHILTLAAPDGSTSAYFFIDR